MKSLNKKLYSVIFACLLMLCFTVGVMATDIDSSVINDTSKTEGTDSSDVVSSDVNSDVTTSTDTEVSSSNTTSTGSFLNSSSEAKTSSDIKEETVSSKSEKASSTINSNIANNVQSNEQISSNNNTSKNSYSNIGGVVNDEPDTSGWGEKQDDTVSDEEDTTKRKDKNITDFSGIFWILIWIPVLLILASVGALVYVNRKAFLEEGDASSNDAIASIPAKKKPSAEEKAKRKNNHKNRTNVYKPRD